MFKFVLFVLGLKPGGSSCRTAVAPSYSEAILGRGCCGSARGRAVSAGAAGPAILADSGASRALRHDSFRARRQDGTTLGSPARQALRNCPVATGAGNYTRA